MKKEEKINKVMSEYYQGVLKDSQGRLVTDKDQALAIAYSESEDIGNQAKIENAMNGTTKENLISKAKSLIPKLKDVAQRRDERAKKNIENLIGRIEHFTANYDEDKLNTCIAEANLWGAR